MSEEINRFGAEQPAVIKTRQGLFGAPDQGDTTGFSQQVTVARTAPAAQRPYGSYFDQIVDILEELIAADGLAVADVIEKVVVEHGELSIFISREHIRRVVRYLRDDQDLRFEMCLGTNGVNYPEDQGRELHAIYPFMSITHNRMIWQERETWDLMGIVCDGHPSLTRTAMPDDWVGHPQRKDYPLGGIPVEFKGAVNAPADTRRSYN